jgi:1-deoxy-D-xylulose-5-phosphate synthase
VAMHRLPVTFVLDRAGITGPDGPSHYGVWDYTILGVVPGMRVGAPRDALTLREELREAVAWEDGPTAIRFPTGVVPDEIPALERIGAADVLRRGDANDVLLVALGAFASTALDVAERAAEQGIGVTVVDPRWVRPVGQEIVELAAEHRLVVTLEDGMRAGGVGTAIGQALRDAGVEVPLRDLGVPAGWHPHGSRAELLAELGLTAQDVARNVIEWVSKLDDEPSASVEPSPRRGANR